MKKLLDVLFDIYKKQQQFQLQETNVDLLNEFNLLIGDIYNYLPDNVGKLTYDDLTDSKIIDGVEFTVISLLAKINFGISLYEVDVDNLINIVSERFEHLKNQRLLEKRNGKQEATFENKPCIEDKASMALIYKLLQQDEIELNLRKHKESMKIENDLKSQIDNISVHIKSKVIETIKYKKQIEDIIESLDSIEKTELELLFVKFMAKLDADAFKELQNLYLLYLTNENIPDINNRKILVEDLRCGYFSFKFNTSESAKIPLEVDNLKKLNFNDEVLDLFIKSNEILKELHCEIEKEVDSLKDLSKSLKKWQALNGNKEGLYGISDALVDLMNIFKREIHNMTIDNYEKKIQKLKWKLVYDDSIIKIIEFVLLKTKEFHMNAKVKYDVLVNNILKRKCLTEPLSEPFIDSSYSEASSVSSASSTFDLSDISSLEDNSLLHLYRLLNKKELEESELTTCKKIIVNNKIKSQLDYLQFESALNQAEENNYYDLVCLLEKSLKDGESFSSTSKKEQSKEGMKLKPLIFSKTKNPIQIDEQTNGTISAKENFNKCNADISFDLKNKCRTI